MANKIYLSSKASNPRGAVVISETNPTPSRLRDLSLLDARATNLYIVDGEGDFDAISGDEDASVVVAIGEEGEDPLWTNTLWTPISDGWSGKIEASAAIADLFDGTNPLALEISFTVTSEAGDPLVYANPLINIWNRYIHPFGNYRDNEWPVPAFADTGSVTGLGLPMVPRRVMVSPLRRPAGGLVIIPTVVDGSISADGFDFELSGQTDSADYLLDYVLIY